MERATRPALVGLTGTNGAGKGEVAAYLGRKGYAYLSLSDVLREELAARGLPASRDNLIAAGNELRERFGAGVLAERTLAKVLGPTVIDSIRNPAEVERLRRRPGFLLIAVDAPVEVRFERARARGRDESAATLEEFQAKEALELSGGANGQQLERCMAMADRRIANDGTLEELWRKVEECL